jgi:integrase
MTKPKLRLVAPTTAKRTVEVPTRLTNGEYRTREYLRPAEVDKLIMAAGKNRWGLRDSTMILLCYRHALRASELVDLEWSQVDFDAANLHVKRAKGSTDAVHPIRGDEMRALRKLRKDNPDGRFVFVSERGSTMTVAGFNRLVQRAGKAAGLNELKPHAHMLRHSSGYALINAGHDVRTLQAYMGHKNIQHTTRYAALADAPFRDFWRK